jgi:hypothetical protein
MFISAFIPVLIVVSLLVIWVRLVELIVLNIGLAAGILSVKVFSMFVLEGMRGGRLLRTICSLVLSF